MITTKNNAETKDLWFSANGEDGWDSADGNEWGADAWGSADGNAGGTAKVRAAQPYIIQMVNACTTAIADVDIGDSFANRAATNFGQNTNITTTSTVSGITYREFLAASESSPFKIGRTMIISTTAGQLDQTIAVTHRNPAGKREDFIISPTLDPNQNQTDRVVDETEYLFDGMTRLRFNQINASATVTVRLYLISKFSPVQIVAGRSSEQFYEKPRIIKVAQVSVDRRLS